MRGRTEGCSTGSSMIGSSFDGLTFHLISGALEVMSTNHNKPNHHDKFTSWGTLSMMPCKSRLNVVFPNVEVPRTWIMCTSCSWAKKNKKKAAIVASRWMKLGLECVERVYRGLYIAQVGP